MKIKSIKIKKRWGGQWMEKNMYTQKQFDKLPKDVKNSLEKLKIILEIIDENCIKGKDYTISKLMEEFNTLQAASKIFSKYYFIENISISRYIYWSLEKLS